LYVRGQQRENIFQWHSHATGEGSEGRRRGAAAWVRVVVVERRRRRRCPALLDSRRAWAAGRIS